MDVIQFLYSIIGTPLGYVLYFIYNFICKNVGVAIILFTFVIKGAMIPLYIKQQKSTAVSAAFTPKIKEIQTKYANNKERQQQELMKLQQQGYKPTAGCLPMLLSFLILFGVIDVVYKPLTHIVHSTGEEISAFVEESYNVEFTSIFAAECAKTDDEAAKLDENARKRHDHIVNDAKKILAYYNENCLSDGEEPKTFEDLQKLDTDAVKMYKTAIKKIISTEYAANNSNSQLSNADIFRLTDDERTAMNELSETEKEAYKLEHSFSDETISALNTLQVQYGLYKATGTDAVPFTATSSLQRELYALECFGTKNDRFEYRTAYSEAAVRPEARAKYEELYKNLNFIGIPLGQVPKDHMGFPMILVPIISFVLSFLQTFISNRNMKKNNPDAAAMGGPMKIMMYTMPLLSLWIAFTVPAGAGFYWAISYAFGILQTIILDKLYNPRKLREMAAAELAAKDKVINVKAAEKSTKITKEEALTQKEENRRKLAEARKADALKYGEEYNEEDDEDNN